MMFLNVEKQYGSHYEALIQTTKILEEYARIFTSLMMKIHLDPLGIYSEVFFILDSFYIALKSSALGAIENRTPKPPILLLHLFLPPKH
jgi:hypothetical protein